MPSSSIHPSMHPSIQECFLSMDGYSPPPLPFVPNLFSLTLIMPQHSSPKPYVGWSRPDGIPVDLLAPGCFQGVPRGVSQRSSGEGRTACVGEERGSWVFHIVLFSRLIDSRTASVCLYSNPVSLVYLVSLHQYCTLIILANLPSTVS